MIEIAFSPVRMDRALTLSATGDVLVLDGVAYDLGPLAEGCVLPGAALGHDMVQGDITRAGGTIRLTLLRPHGEEAAEADRFPAPLQGAAGGTPGGIPGTVDWALLQSAEARAAADLEAWRDGARMSRTAFCLALAGAGLLSGAEAVAAARGEIPAAFAPVLGSLPPAQQTELGIRWAAMTEIERLNPFIALVAGAVAITPEALDTIFGRG